MYDQCDGTDRPIRLGARSPFVLWRRLYLHRHPIVCADAALVLADGEAPFSGGNVARPVLQGKWVYRVIPSEQPQVRRCSPVTYLLSRSRVEAIDS